MLIYAISWICKTTGVKGFVLGVLILFAVVANKGVVVACLVGYLTGFLKQRFETSKVSKAALVCGVLSPVVGFFTESLFVMDMTFVLCLLSVPLIPQVKSFFEASVVKKTGSVSFGIYALHWPVINSIGLGILCTLGKEISSAPLMIVSLLGVLIATFILAILFKITVERLTLIVCSAVFIGTKCSEEPDKSDLSHPGRY